MKLSNKLIILSACICAFAFSLLLSAWLKPSSDNEEPKSTPAPLGKNSEDAQNALPAENNISPSIDNPPENTKYILRLEDNRICAYVSSPDSGEFLWNSMRVPPTLSADELDRLEKGISTSGFEEMCLYFESYAS